METIAKNCFEWTRDNWQAFWRNRILCAKIIFKIFWPFYYKHHLESSSKELLADNGEPSLINDDNAFTIDEKVQTSITKVKTIQDDEKTVFKKVIETENSIIEISRNF